MPEAVIAAILLILNTLGRPFGLTVPVTPPVEQPLAEPSGALPVPGVNPVPGFDSVDDFPELLAPTGISPDSTNFTPATFSTNLISSVGVNRLLFFVPNALGALASGQAGQFLQSQGTDLPPQWSDLSINNVVNNIYNNTNNSSTTVVSGGGSVDWAIPGVIGSTTPNSAFFTGISLAGATYPLQVGSSNQFQVDNNGRLQVAYNGDSGFLSSNGGVIFLNNTNNIGTGIGIYSNAGSDALGNMINVKVDNPLYDQAAFYMNYDGLSNAVEIVSNSNDGSSNALAVTGNNINDSTVGIIGYELARGTVKITHNRPGSGNDNSASALSIDLKGSGTRAQGVYVDSTESGGTLGNLLRLRNQSIDQFVVNFEGDLTLTGDITQGANGTNTTYTKRGNVVGDEFFVGTNASFRIQRSASNSEAFRTQVAGDTQGRWVGTSDGRLRWGSGSAVSDVTLRRSGAGALLLEGSLAIDTGLSVIGSTTFNTVAYTWPANAGSSGQMLTTNGSGDLAWTTPSSATNYWQQNGAVISPGNSTFDLAVGGNATSSALFVVRGANGNITHGLNGVNTTFTKVGNTVGDEFFIGTNGAFRSQRSLANSEAFRVQVLGDTQGRLVTTSDGRFTWGPGNAAGDTVLRRGDVGILWLEGGITINNGNGTFNTVIKGASDNNLFFADSTRNFIGIGLSSPIAPLHISKNGNGNAAVIINQLGASDLLVASASGVTKFRVDNNGNVGVNGTAFGTDSVGVLAITNSTAPSTSITNGIQLFAVDVTGSHELRVRDEAGNVTTLSPHNFSLIPDGQSEDLAWAFYSERNGLAINADMTRALRLVEELTGEQLIYIENLQTGEEVVGWNAESLELPVAVSAQTQLADYFTWGDTLLDVLTEAIFKARVRFEQTATFISQAVFKRGVVIEGEVMVDSSTAGWAEIPAGAQQVRITFNRAFSQTPTVFLDSSGLSTAAVVEAVTTTSFSIKLDQPMGQATQIRWLAVVNQGGASSTVEVLGAQTQQEPAESPVIPSPPASPEPSILPSPSPSPTPEITPPPEEETATDSAIVTSQNP